MQYPESYQGVVRTGGVGLGDDRVKFPLYTWNLRKAATQPLTYLLPLQAGALYIVLMLLFNCLADGHSATARITLLQDSPDSLALDQVKGAASERGNERQADSGLAGTTWLFSLVFEIYSQGLAFYEGSYPSY